MAATCSCVVGPCSGGTRGRGTRGRGVDRAEDIVERGSTVARLECGAGGCGVVGV